MCQFLHKHPTFTLPSRILRVSDRALTHVSPSSVPTQLTLRARVKVTLVDVKVTVDARVPGYADTAAHRVTAG